MSGKPKVTITVDTDGKVTMAVQGVKGKSCSVLTAEIEKALGQTTKDSKTSDYYGREENARLNHRA